MAYTIQLTGFPNVLRAKVFQGCGAQPGIAVVDTAVQAGNLTNYPTETTLTIVSGANTLTWANMRIKNAPRVRRGYMRIILEDSRWKLQQCTLGADYNLRDGLGHLVAAHQQTVAQLAGTLASAAGITINAGTTVPTWNPPASWIGKRGDQALRQLLHDGVMRCVYNPIDQTYSLWSAGSGSLPSTTTRLYRQGPTRLFGSISVDSAPIVYESRLDATAVVTNDAGEIKTVATYDGDGYFDGFLDQAADKPLQSRLRETAFRLWQVSSANKELLSHRALPLSFAPYRVPFAAAKLIGTDMSTQMREHPVYPIDQDAQKIWSSCDATLYHTPEPFLRSSGGSLLTTATILCGYYTLSGGKRTVRSLARAVHGSGGNKSFQFDWIRPIESAEDDVGTDNWATVHGQVADAMQAKFTPSPQTVTLPGLPTFTESGHIGAVQYSLSLFPRKAAITRIACDFDPLRTGVR